MSEPGWITKREAAALAEVDERTIERKARAGKITSKGRPGFPTVYLLTDVELLRQVGHGDVRTGILEHGPAGNGNGNGAVASLRTHAPVFDDRLDLVLDRLLAKLPAAPIGPTGPTIAPTGPTAAYVAKPEALAIAGVSAEELRKAVQAGEVKMRGRRYRRTDLEQL